MKQSPLLNNDPDSIAKYHVVSEDNLVSLILKVERFISYGWVPCGGIGHSGTEYLQAMTITNKNKKLKDAHFETLPPNL